MTVLILSNLSRHYLCNRATIFYYIDENSPKQRSPEVRMIRPETSYVFTARMWKVRTAKKILVVQHKLKIILPEHRCGNRDTSEVDFK
jgi:hypothetical protein